MPTRSTSANRTALLVAQLNELSRREMVSTAVAFPAMLVVVWVHRNVVLPMSSLSWLICLSVLLLVRLSLSRKSLLADSNEASVLHVRNLRILLSILYGAGWGAMLFVFDSGHLDFLFMFKIATLAGVLGVTVNALSVVLPVYVGFAIPLILLIMAHVLAAPFLQQEEQMALFIGVAVYGVLLVIAAFNVTKLTRFALEQGFALEETNKSLHEANARLNVLARQDALTGAFNRRHLMDELERQLHLLTRYKTNFSIIILDIDHFKAVNDTHGHQIGDSVLIGLTRLLADNLREIDVFGRWGGEEFLCILPNTPIPEALYCAERLRSNLEKAQLIDTHPELLVTASFGVGTCLAGETIDALVKRVDTALYAAKAAGRNRVQG
jgi:diguanylate cyclase (GGDEF)-like protein